MSHPWRTLQVYTISGPTGDTLVDLLNDAPANFDEAELNGDRLVRWPAFDTGDSDLLDPTRSIGEPDFWLNANSDDVDWTGFAAALEIARQGGYVFTQDEVAALENGRRGDAHA